MASRTCTEMTLGLEIEEGRLLRIRLYDDLTSRPAISTIRDRVSGPPILIKGMAALPSVAGLDPQDRLIDEAGPPRHRRQGGRIATTPDFG
jgi:hypothetical protein